MAKTGGDILIDTLTSWGVEVIFGLPGDGINGIMEALRQRQDKVRFLQVRHEEARGVHGLRLRQVHGQAGRLPGHVRSRRHSSAERSVRRQDGRPAGPGDHRASLP